MATTGTKLDSDKKPNMKDLVLQAKSSDGTPVEGAEVLVAYQNNTRSVRRSDADGRCEFGLYRTDEPMKVLVAAEGHLPLLTTIDPKVAEAKVLNLEPSKDDRRALLFTQSTGYIPGIEGRLNPHKGGYVYANNIAINGQLATPAVAFELEEPLHLIDVYGMETIVRFLVVEGQFSLIEYTEPKAYAGN